MQYLFRLGQMFKPEASVEQYAPLLRAAFAEWSSAPEPPESMIPASPEMVQYLREQSAFWERLNARRLELEAVRPDARLARIHEESIKFLRGTLTVFNVLAAATQMLLQGNMQESYRKNQEAESWAPVLGSVSKKLGFALSQLQDQQPTLFSMLRLPPEVLLDFGVSVTDASQIEGGVDPVWWTVCH